MFKPGTKVIKLFILNSAEHEMKTASERFKTRKTLIFMHLKFLAQSS